MPRGVFIVLEGGEGAGKSTLAAALAARLEATGRDVLLCREPGGTGLGEAVRGLLRAGDLVPWSETFLFLAARAQLVDRVIRPALDAGKVVVCDRFAASTFAYQGYGRGLDLTRLRVANRVATDGLEPDLTVFLDLDPAAGLRRKDGEVDAIAIGAETLAFHERVREGYRTLAAESAPGTWVTLDAGMGASDVAEAAWRVIWPRIRARRANLGG